ncbi:MAG: uroporphyrinogen-III C-methyltransferase [Burkholderiales bacterium]|nr:uroporphyrinogen-III C-methyltransferase [Burkholderiales bacterium]
MNDTSPDPERGAPEAARRRWLAAAALAAFAALAAALWLDTRGRLQSMQEETARRLRELETEAREARAQARRAEDALRALQAQLGALEARVADSQSQQAALEALYQELARNRDEWQLAEIEQVLAIAQQQLQLAGNVRAALLALQLAEARLARADRPQFLALRRALARDIERLRALPALDVAGLSLRLDGLVAAVDGLPLAYEERAAREPRGAEPPAGEGALARFGAEVWRELKSLVVVRRIEGEEPPLVPPREAYFLRENLKLRLLSARVALLSRNEAGYREDLRAAQTWIERYFDVRAKSAQAALAQLKSLAAASVAFEPPSLGESLDALRALKTRRERG